MPNYFEQNTTGLNRGINNLATAFARQPYYQTLAQNRAAQAGYANARAGEQSSLSDLNRARTADLLRKGVLVDTLQRVSPTAQSAMLSGNFDDPSVQQFTGAVSALTGQDRGDVQKSMKQGLGTILALRGQTPMAAAVENPVSVQNNQVNADERAARPLVGGKGASLFSPNGAILGTAPITGATNPAPAVSSAANGNPTPSQSQLIQLSSPIPTNGLMPTSPAPTSQPPANHIIYLRSHPEASADFDAKYGKGMAAQYLGQPIAAATNPQ